MYRPTTGNGLQLRRTTFAVIALTMFGCTALGAAAAPKSDSTKMMRQGEDAAQPRASLVDAELRDRVVKLEAKEGAVDRRLDDVRESMGERIADNRDLTFLLFGAVVAVIATISVPIIVRERREKKEIREFARGELTRIKSQISDAQDGVIAQLDDIALRVEAVRTQVTEETNALKQSFVDGVRAQAQALQHELEADLLSKKDALVSEAPAQLAELAMVRVKAQMEAFEKTLSSLNAPPQPVDFLLRAQFHLQQKDQPNYRAAIEECKRALELDPNNADGLFILASAQKGLGALEDARVNFERVRGIDRTSDRATMSLIDIALSTGDTKHARLLIDEIERKGGFPNLSQLALVKATLLRKEGRTLEAAQQLRESLALQPQNSVIRGALLEQLIKNEIYEEAESVSSAGIAINPADHAMRVERARALAGMGRFDEALSELDVAQRANPADIRIYLTRSRLFAKAGKYESSVEAARDGLRLKAPTGFRALLLCAQAAAMARIRDWPGATEAARQAVTLGPNYLLNNLLVVECLFCAGHYAEARIASEEGIQRFPKDKGRAIFSLFLALTAVAQERDPARISEHRAQLESAAREVREAGDVVELDFEWLSSCIGSSHMDEKRKEQANSLLNVLRGAKPSPEG